MGFLEGFWGGKKEDGKEEREPNLGGKHIAIPPSPKEDLSEEDINLEQQITFLRGKIEAIEMNPNHPDADQLGSLEEKLANLLASQKRGL